MRFFLLQQLLFARDCALMSYTQSDAQSIVSDFFGAATSYGLTSNIKKTEVLFQPGPGAPPHNPIIMVGGEQLRVVDKLGYLVGGERGVLSRNTRRDDKSLPTLVRPMPHMDGSSIDCGQTM